MELAVSLPRHELGLDAAKLKDFIQGAEQLGYTQVHVGDHILGADPTHRPGWNQPYTHEAFWHDPITILSFLAAHTQRMLLVSAVLVLPLRQTLLVAKQAAQLDGLSGGRLRLGIGVGSNEVEFEALGQDYHTRGRRVEEQVALLRALWTERVVTFEGKWDRIFEMGLNPMPVQRPIPIWMGGGGVESVLKRIARLSDGWIVSGTVAERGDLAGAIERLHRYTREAGRDPASLVVTGRGNAAAGTPDDWRKNYELWKNAGATHLVIGSASGNDTSADKCVDALRRYKEAVEG